MKLSNFKEPKLIAIVLWTIASLVYLSYGTASGAAAGDPVSSALGPGDIYAANCAKCHGANGKAQTAKGKRAGATDFTSDWNRDQARGIRIITKGKGEMPSFKGKLSPAEIQSVFGYVLHFR